MGLLQTDATRPPNPYVARVADLAPLIARSADEAERLRQLPATLVHALHDAGIFRLLLPKVLGGAELDPVSFVEVTEAIAKIDGSTAWCVCQNNGCSMVAAYLPPATAAEIFGDPRGVLAWGPGPSRAVAVDGGYRISGTWSFASGMRHANWLGGHCPIYQVDGTPRLRADGKPEQRTMLFPAASATITDVWRVMGLRGTGSDTFTVTDLYVPHERSVSRDDPSERRQPGLLYCFSSGNLYASGFAGVALGLARTMLESFLTLAQDKTPRGYSGRLRESATVQAHVALSEARLGAARRYLIASLVDITEAVRGTGTVTIEQRMVMRAASTFAIHQARDVADTVYRAAGGTAIFENGVFERRFRDINTVTQQLQGREQHFETVGRLLLGLDADTTWL
jgi:alkylation response protein AidB-like acyl-CoA dehydrogenase